jgi:ferredoxin
MSAYRVVIDRSLCSGFGSCVEHASAVFELGSNGIASARIGESDDPAVIEAAFSCPMGAIAVYAVETAEQVA